MVRLNKFLSDAGVCSRREADRLIESGQVTVDGVRGVCGMKVGEDQEVRVARKVVGRRRERIVLAVNKPVGIVCTEERREKKSIIRYLNYPERITYAGRLDKDSEGLLLLTNDGDLIEAVMRGAHRHEKEYTVKVNQEITPQFLEQMAAGIYLRELKQTTRPCEIRQTGKYTFQIILTQGLNRQIRRMCQACGYEVRQLKRIRIMQIGLEHLIPGQYREVQGRELEQLYRDAGLTGPGS